MPLALQQLRRRQKQEYGNQGRQRGKHPDQSRRPTPSQHIRGIERARSGEHSREDDLSTEQSDIALLKGPRPRQPSPETHQSVLQDHSSPACVRLAPSITRHPRWRNWSRRLSGKSTRGQARQGLGRALWPCYNLASLSPVVVLWNAKNKPSGAVLSSRSGQAH